MIIVRFPKRDKEGLKTQNGRFRYKIALRLKKVCYKVSLSENCKQQCFKAFIGRTIRAKNDWWRRPFLPEILCQTDRVGAKLPIFTALHGMQSRYSDGNSVCPSVCLSVRLSVRLSVKRVHCDKTEKSYV